MVYLDIKLTKIIVTVARNIAILNLIPKSEIWTSLFIIESVDLVYCQDNVCYQILTECLHRSG